MTFAHPDLLWLLLLPVALLVWEITHRRRAARSSHPKILQAEAGAHSLTLSSLHTPLASATSRPRVWLGLGLALSTLAAARPQWGRLEEPVFDQSREILLAIDLSRSMLTPDVKPSRLERAKLLTQSLLEKLTGERVGLVVFSGTAFLQSPLSSDYEILRDFLPALDPAYLPEGGTHYGALLDTAFGAFGSTGAADRFLIVLSDGEATDDDWRSRLPELKKKGIRVLGLGVGTATGAMIPDLDGGFVKDDRGAVVLSKLESATLQELATATNGVYQDASAWIDVASLLSQTVEAGQKGEFLEKNTVRLVERFQWPLAFALWCFLVSFCYEFPVRPKPRDLKLGAAPVSTPPTPKPSSLSRPAAGAATAATLALLLAAFVAPPARAAEDTGPALGRIYTRLAEQEKLSAQDYAELARETLRWGTRIKENRQPVTPGPVHDAIQAVDELIAINSRLADWSKLRAELAALLESPEDRQPKQDQQKQQQDQKDQSQQQQQNSSDQPKQDQPKQNPSPSPDQKQQQDPSNQSQPKPGEQKPDSPQDQPQQQDGQNPPPTPDPEKQQNAESAFGDMKDRPPSPPQPPQDTQKVGGVPEKKPSDPSAQIDPTLALPLQKLDQLKNQDSPAQLFQLMEGDKSQRPAAKKSKDW